jgi:hypothetical protein
MAHNIYQARNVFNFLSNEEEGNDKSSNSSTNNNTILEYQNESSIENDVSFFHPPQSPINNSAANAGFNDEEFSIINSNDRNNPLLQHSNNNSSKDISISNNSSSSSSSSKSDNNKIQLGDNSISKDISLLDSSIYQYSVEGGLIKNMSNKNTSSNSYYNSSSSLTKPPTSGYSPREWGENHPVDKNAKRAEWSTAEKNYLIPLAESLKRINATNLFARCLKHIKNDPLATPIFHRRHVLDSDRIKSCLVTFEKHNKDLQLDE